MKRCEGPDCEVEFEPRRSTARFCSTTCRSRAARARKAAETETQSGAEPTVGGAEDGLVASVRAELETAGRTDSFHGQLALQLARRLSDPGESGISSLSKELRLVMDAALDRVEPADDRSIDEGDAETEDEVTRARRQREEARQAAGLA